jgi:hypothetical protein
MDIFVFFFPLVIVLIFAIWKVESDKAVMKDFILKMEQIFNLKNSKKGTIKFPDLRGIQSGRELRIHRYLKNVSRDRAYPRMNVVYTLKIPADFALLLETDYNGESKETPMLGSIFSKKTDPFKAEHQLVDVESGNSEFDHEWVASTNNPEVAEEILYTDTLERIDRLRIANMDTGVKVGLRIELENCNLTLQWNMDITSVDYMLRIINQLPPLALIIERACSSQK